MFTCTEGGSLNTYKTSLKALEVDWEFLYEEDERTG